LEYSATFKIIIFGDSNTGKTTLAHRYITNQFSEDLSMTLGVEFQIKIVDVEGQKVKLQIWDFAGEDRFRFLLPNYVKGASAGIFMYDMTKHASLAHVDDWFSIVMNSINYEIPIIFVGGKSDLTHLKQVSTKKAMKIAREKNAFTFLECSSKTGENVNKLFDLLTKLILKTKKQSSQK